ncbi:hypothetical protein C1H46_014972 [Malus baccata]|uniref:Uncharacterized protein n=1 Tax=Malus baccata TaxID=106549 RepID=A0A540MMH4_MALBA|nr:hypothetical protein C1H46_014972 [Malus baccata]
MVTVATRCSYNLASHITFVTVNWYILYQRLIGIRVELLGPSCAKGRFSKREERVATTGMAMGELGVPRTRRGRE